MLLMVCFHCIQVCTYEEGHRCYDSDGKEYESNSENVLLVRAEPENMSNFTREWNPHRADNETNLGFPSRKSTGNGFRFSVVTSKPGNKMADTECQPSDNGVSAFNLKTSDRDFSQRNEMKNDRQYHFMNEDKLTENRRTSDRPSRGKHSDGCEPSTRTCLPEHDVASAEQQKRNIFPPEVSRSQIQFVNEMAFQQCETAKSIQNQNETFGCDPSDNDTTITENLKDQSKVHVNTNSYDCDICYKRYSTEKLLKTHFLSHMGQKTFECCDCDYVTMYKQKIKRHRHYNCGICNKSFTVQKQLNTHYLSHEGWKTFKCDECEFVTMYKQNLNQHKKVHKKNSCITHYPSTASP